MVQEGRPLCTAAGSSWWCEQRGISEDGTWQTEDFLTPFSGAQGSGVSGACDARGGWGADALGTSQTPSTDGPELPCRVGETESIPLFNKGL